ncbi:uncharacterized protein [Antennarius striatus]|uniref:uncharacterized protein isoform X2 n=1 Tax=Antennarius striatus TaxID=241820 RepID=UPI0035AE67C7
MAAPWFRGGAFRLNRCRLTWRPLTTPFSSRPSDRKQPRRTHIKKAKPQPALDVVELLEQLFSQRRPGSAAPSGGALPTHKAPSSPSVKTSHSRVPPLVQPEPVVFSTSPASSNTPGSSDSSLSSPLEPMQESVPPTGSNQLVIEGPASAETTEPNGELAPEEHVDTNGGTSSPLKLSEPSAELRPSTVEMCGDGAASVEGPVQLMPDVSSASTEPMIEMTVEPAVEATAVFAEPPLSDVPAEPAAEPRSSDLHELEAEGGRLLCPASDPPAGTDRESLLVEETQESITEPRGLDTKVLLETWRAFHKEAEGGTKEEMEVKTTTGETAVLEDTSQAEMLSLDSISEGTEAEVDYVKEVVVGSQPLDVSLVDQNQQQQDENVLHASALKFVSLAEAPSGTEALSGTSDDLETEAERLVEETRMEVENGAVSDGTTYTLQTECVFEGAPTEELLCSDTGHVTVATENHIQEVGGADTLKGVDPVQRLFLEKIREYRTHSWTEGRLEAELDYQQRLSQETKELQRRHGGGDLSRFPEFTFSEPRNEDPNS